MLQALRLRCFLPILLMAGKLPARGPDVTRLASELRTPARDNPATPGWRLWAVVMVGVALVILVAALLLLLVLFR